MSTKSQRSVIRVSYWQIFRLIFVIFSFYLVADTLYRWNGYSYHSTFFEILPSVYLITVLWSVVAVFTAMMIWLPIRILEWFCLRIGWKIKTEHWLLLVSILVLLTVIVWGGKLLVWSHFSATLKLKLSVFLGVALTAIFLTRIFRNNAERWIIVIQEHIAIWVWLFGILVIFSMTMVAYDALEKQKTTLSQNIIQSTGIDENRPNIILVTFDSLAARNMSVYGYRRLTTPFIDEWAKKASLFTMVESESNWTPSTTTSLMTGKRVWTHQKYHEDPKPVKSDIENIALLLKNHGYYNMAFTASFTASPRTLGISDSFDVVPPPTEFMTPFSLFSNFDKHISKFLFRLTSDKVIFYKWIVKGDFIFAKLIGAITRNYYKITETEFPPEKVFNRFIEVLDDKRQEPFFAWIHLDPPHDPYLPPEPYMGMFDPSPELRTQKSLHTGMVRGGKYEFKWKHFPQEVQPTVELLRARYDEFIRYCDKQFEDFIAKLATKNKSKNTVIILSADHGESFEHGNLGHSGPQLYEQITNIPLIIKEPGQSKGRVIHDLIEQIDIPATILEFANITAPSWMQGRSLLPLMRDKRLPSKLAFSMNFENNLSRGHQITKGIIAVWEGEYKLIHHLNRNKSLLFNLKDDPDELNNLFNKEPDLGQRLLTIIQDNLRQANEKIVKGE